MSTFLRRVLPLLLLGTLSLSSRVTAYRQGPPPARHYYRHGYGRPLPPPPPPRGPYRY